MRHSKHLAQGTKNLTIDSLLIFPVYLILNSFNRCFGVHLTKVFEYNSTIFLITESWTVFGRS